MMTETTTYKYNPTTDELEQIWISDTINTITPIIKEIVDTIDVINNNKQNNGELKTMENTTQNETKQNTALDNWLAMEEAQLKSPGKYEKLPALKLETGKITSFEIDFGKPFEKWTDEKNGKTITKAIIPVTQNGAKLNLWLNLKNPLYADIIHAGRTSQKLFKVFTTGTQAETKYALVKE